MTYRQPGKCYLRTARTSESEPLIFELTIIENNGAKQQPTRYER